MTCACAGTWSSETDRGEAGDLGVHEACSGSPDGSVLTRGDTLLLSNSRHVLMQEIIWLYNPVLAVKMWQQRVR